MTYHPEAATIFGGAVVLVVFFILFTIAVTVINYVALFKIITKAGYSGAWIIIPLLPPIGYFITLLSSGLLASSALNNGLNGNSSGVDWGGLVGLWVLDGIIGLVVWVFFLIFAFSDWPVRRQAAGHRGGQPGSRDSGVVF
jgi:uncharacterized membrane protein